MFKIPKMPDHYGTVILATLQRGRHMYAGTVPPAEVARRRERNRVARRSRKINRGR